MRYAAGKPEDQSEVIAFLSQPASYDGEATSVARYETHGSTVFLAGDHAYKLKRAVRFPYMDFSTVERRRSMCERELRVNRRTAPMLYREVRPVVRTANGSLRFGSASEDGSAVDWVVVMQRFDQESLLENKRRAGRLSVSLMRLVAESIARLHRNAEIIEASGPAAGILAGADILAHPAHFEPCGLVPMYALRYGAIPLVRRSGGMSDTVTNATVETMRDGTATGFVFEDASARAFLDAARRAMSLYGQPIAWRKIQGSAMIQDFSWARSAAAYAQLYRSLADRHLTEPEPELARGVS